jgi:hypothetical protein
MKEIKVKGYDLDFIYLYEIEIWNLLQLLEVKLGGD